MTNQNVSMTLKLFLYWNNNDNLGVVHFYQIIFIAYLLKIVLFTQNIFKKTEFKN